jgi:hypothetical protein
MFDRFVFHWSKLSSMNLHSSAWEIFLYSELINWLSYLVILFHLPWLTASHLHLESARSTNQQYAVFRPSYSGFQISHSGIYFFSRLSWNLADCQAFRSRERSGEHRVKELLLRQYDPTTRPVRNDSTPVRVQIAISLYHILDTVSDSVAIYRSSPATLNDREILHFFSMMKWNSNWVYVCMQALRGCGGSCVVNGWMNEWMLIS